MDTKEWHLRLSSDMHICVHTQADVPQHKQTSHKHCRANKTYEYEQFKMEHKHQNIQSYHPQRREKKCKVGMVSFLST